MIIRARCRYGRYLEYARDAKRKHRAYERQRCSAENELSDHALPSFAEDDYPP
jgi:hypothetical protein